MNGLQSYFGLNDVFDYGQQLDFMGENATNNHYGLKLTNTSVVDQVVALSPAILMGLSESVINGKVSGIDGYIDAEGTVIDTLDDGEEGTTGAVTVESLENENPIELFLTMAALMPLRIVKLELNTDKKAQFSNKIEQRIISPFKTTDDELSINLRKFVNADQFQNDRTDVPLLETNQVLTLSMDSVIYFKLTASSTFEINMDIGAINNAAATLRKRAALAYSNMVRARKVPRQK